MRIKRIYTFMLQTFLPMFCMTFMICLFIVLMQFLWRYVDDLVGKGLGFGVMAELFFYAALTLVPMALPLAILLASLMTFGNLGESLELLAMKASGISLLKIMRPLIIFIILLSIGAFYFQNDILPIANTKMYSLLIGIKNKSPELEIPEGVFYKEINDYNIYVGKKDFETGLLKDVIIYIFEGTNIEDATVTVADSARMEATPDGQHMKMTLWSGEQVGTFKSNSQNRMSQERHPKYRRESFRMKEVYIPYNNDLERTDESMITSRHVGKNLAELRLSVDSLDQRIDSINIGYGKQLVDRTYYRTVNDRTKFDSLYFAEKTGAYVAEADPKVKDPEKIVQREMPINLDSIYASLRPAQKAEVARKAKDRSNAVVQTFDVRKEMQNIEYKNRSYHIIEIHKKFVLSICCIIFFLIGAPLGAIIRKGGLGVPIITSVAFFIVYFVIDTAGNNRATNGEWAPWAGVWLSSMVLAPIGIFLTWRAINDSTLFDIDAYRIGIVKAWRWLCRKIPFMKKYQKIGKGLAIVKALAHHRHH